MLLNLTVSGQGSIARCCEHGSEALVLTEGDKLIGCHFLTKDATAVL